MEIKIFVEGIADKVFIHDFISFHFNIQLDDKNIITTEGWNLVEKNAQNSGMIINQMQINSDNNGTNLVIFDADNDFETRKSQILAWRDKQQVDFELFLWPDNKKNGDLEVMLENIINPVNQPIFDCWSKYENCLKKVTIEGRDTQLTLPARKTKIHGYLETLYGPSNKQKKKAKEPNRDYRNEDHWNLNDGFLSPLKDFLERYFHENEC
jgi:hypothetical protein